VSEEMFPVMQLGKTYFLTRCANGCDTSELIVVPPDDIELPGGIARASAGCFFCGTFEDAKTIEEAIEKWNLRD